MKKILFLIEFLPFSNLMSSIRVKEIMRYLIKENWEIFSFSFFNGKFFKNVFYKKKVKNFNFFVCIGKDYKNKNSFLKFIYKVIMTLRSLYYLRKIIGKNNIKKIWVSVPKYYPLFFAFILKLFLNNKVQIFLEYRDIFSLNKIAGFSKFKGKFLLNIEKFLLKRIDKFIFSTKVIKEIYINNFYGTNNRIYLGLILYTGFNTKYYKRKIIKVEKKLVFTYAGSFYQDRNPLFFLYVFSDFIQSKNAYLTNEIILNLIINFCQKDIYKEIKIKLLNKNLVNIVRIIQQLSYVSVNNWLNNSDILILITHKKGSEYALPGKLPCYVGAKRNILAISNDNLVKEAIVNDKLGWICGHDDYEGLTNILNEIYTKWKDKSLTFGGNYKKYSVNERFKELNNFLLM